MGKHPTAPRFRFQAPRWKSASILSRRLGATDRFTRSGDGGPQLAGATAISEREDTMKNTLTRIAFGTCFFLLVENTYVAQAQLGRADKGEVDDPNTDLRAPATCESIVSGHIAWLQEEDWTYHRDLRATIVSVEAGTAVQTRATYLNTEFNISTSMWFWPGDLVAGGGALTDTNRWSKGEICPNCAAEGRAMDDFWPCVFPQYPFNPLAPTEQAIIIASDGSSATVISDGSTHTFPIQCEGYLITGSYHTGLATQSTTRFVIGLSRQLIPKLE